MFCKDSRPVCFTIRSCLFCYFHHLLVFLFLILEQTFQQREKNITFQSSISNHLKQQNLSGKNLFSFYQGIFFFVTYFSMNKLKQDLLKTYLSYSLKLGYSINIRSESLLNIVFISLSLLLSQPEIRAYFNSLSFCVIVFPSILTCLYWDLALFFLFCYSIFSLSWPFFLNFTFPISDQPLSSFPVPDKLLE